MNIILTKIKRLIITGHFVFTATADAERLVDGLTQEVVLESILNSSFVRAKNIHQPVAQGPS
jgi:hypothetical protein